MIFQHTIDSVLSGEKTQTRRIVKPGEKPVDYEFFLHCGMFKERPLTYIRAVRHMKSGYRYEVGKSYAVQPGRWEKGIARICLSEIRRENVRNISDRDVTAEGFESRFDFLLIWTAMHDTRARRERSRMGGYDMSIDSINNLWTAYLLQRPDDLYDAWALTFELVR